MSPQSMCADKSPPTVCGHKHRNGGECCDEGGSAQVGEHRTSSARQLFAAGEERLWTKGDHVCDADDEAEGAQRDQATAMYRQMALASAGSFLVEGIGENEPGI